MTPVDADWLARAARRLRLRYDLAVMAASVASALLAGAMAFRFGLPAAPAAVVGVGVGVLVCAFTLPRRRSSITPAAVARHLNRTTPAAEESAELLLSPADLLPTVAQWQRRRVAAGLRPLNAAPPIPGAVYRAPLMAALWMTVGAILVMAVPALGNDPDPFVPGVGDPRVESAVSGPMVIRLDEVSIRPPADRKSVV